MRKTKTKMPTEMIAQGEMGNCPVKDCGKQLKRQGYWPHMRRMHPRYKGPHAQFVIAATAAKAVAEPKPEESTGAFLQLDVAAGTARLAREAVQKALDIVVQRLHEVDDQIERYEALMVEQGELTRRRQLLEGTIQDLDSISRAESEKQRMRSQSAKVFAAGASAAPAQTA